MPKKIDQHFSFRHLDEGPQQDIAQLYADLAANFRWLADGPDKDEAAAKLLESRDAALRAAETMVR
jgi:hypothetical protein